MTPLEHAAEAERAGRLDEAAALYRAATLAAPDAAAWSALGRCLLQRGRWSEAASSYESALRLAPGDADNLANYGMALAEQGLHEQASQAYRRALAAQPDHAVAHYNLGNACSELGDVGLAIDAYREALRLKPEFSSAYNNLGGVLQRRGDLPEAEQAYAAALRLNPHLETALNGLGLVRFEQGQLGAAIELYRRALRRRPDFAEAHLNLGLALLITGQLREGWEEYEWRWRAPSLKLERRHADQPRWQGEPLTGKTILLHCEQGLGDTIQFARLARTVAGPGVRVMLEVEPPVYELCQRSLAGVDVYSKGEAIPAFDYQCPLLSVPRVLDITLENVPARIPYLVADGMRQQHWQARIGNPRALCVGLAWAGSGTHRYDRTRSVPAAALRPLLEVPGARHFSLQKGPAARQAQALGSGEALVDWTAELASFADTAALVSCLDLIITVDTAVAHLAGALGKPVWLLTPFAPDWRWLLAREDSPWYPTMRLFRQSRPDDWDEVVERVRAALTLRCASRPESLPDAREEGPESVAPRATGSEVRRRKSVIAKHATDLARWSDDRQLDPAWERRAALAADHIAAGSTVLDLGCGAMTLERCLPLGCAYLPVDVVRRDERTRVCDFNRDGLPSAGGASAVAVLGVLEYVFDVRAFLRGLRGYGLPIVLSYCPVDFASDVDRGALGWVNHLSRQELIDALSGAGLHVRAEQRIDGLQVLLKVVPQVTRIERSPSVAILSFNNVGNFGDRLGYHLVNEILPAHATVTHAHFRPWDLPDEPFDLLVLGTGNSLFDPLLSDRLAALLERVPAAVGVFGTQYRDELDARKLAEVLDRLAVWYARNEEDLLLYGKGRKNATHLGDWLVSAFPMTRGHDDRVLNIGDEVWNDLPLDRTIQRVQSHRRVHSTRLHPLLCALTSAASVAYTEQRETPARSPSGKFRSMLIDVFGRTYPEGDFFEVERQAVLRYKRHVQSAMAEMRATLASLLGFSPYQG
jgi:tetratricopeptide (TPR) repeat protein